MLKNIAKSLLHDKQSEPDHRELRIDKVGVRGLRLPVQVRDRAHTLQNTVATVALFVDLPKEFKGTHMSRFIEVLNAHGDIVHVENITIFSTPCRRSSMRPLLTWRWNFRTS